MKTKLITFTLAALTALSASQVMANNHFGHPEGKDGTQTPKIDRHIAKQSSVVERAEAAHKLTPEQAAQQRASIAKINADLKEAKSDGKVTKEERSKLRDELKANGQTLRHDIRSNRADATKK